MLFPFAEYWSFYAGFIGIVFVLLLLDLGVFHRKAHEVGIKESAIWTAIWIALALVFNVCLYYYVLEKFPLETAKQVSLEFLTGFLIEKSLAVDNIFVFVVVFTFFAVPRLYQHRVLFYGILGALFFRAIFIALGATLLQYQWIVVVAGVFLILTGLKIFVSPEKAPDPGANILIKMVRKFVPVTTEQEGPLFFTRIRGVLHATPLFLALVFIEFSDIIFAIDSVPAIFAITKEPFIVFTSNIFAILGMRSLYFMLAGVVHLFRFLKFGLGAILVFVGLKMVYLNEAFGGKFPITWSLGIIGGILASSILLSVIFKPKLSLTERKEL